MATAAVAVGTLLLGLVVGFFLGRATDADSTATPPPLTSPSRSTTIPPGDTIAPFPTTPPTSGGQPTDPGSGEDQLPATTLGTREAPIPVGQTWVLGSFELTVLDAELDATETLVDHDARNEPTGDGTHPVLVRLRITFTEDDQLADPSIFEFFVEDGSGEQWLGRDAQCGIVPDDLRFTPFLGSGESVEANLCFTVDDAAADPLLLGTDRLLDAVYFALG